jgi:hypothetical protein
MKLCFAFVANIILAFGASKFVNVSDFISIIATRYWAILKLEKEIIFKDTILEF